MTLNMARLLEPDGQSSLETADLLGFYTQPGLKFTENGPKKERQFSW